MATVNEPGVELPPVASVSRRALRPPKGDLVIDDLDLPIHEGEPPSARCRIIDDLDLPDSDGEIVENVQELPQVLILTDAIRPTLLQLYPDEQFLIGGNSGIYWQMTDPYLNGAVSPDWFLVPGVPPQMVRGHRRRSYVLWNEVVPPLIVLEFVSRDGAAERDRTPFEGKFWVYERAVKAPYYGIFTSDPARLDEPADIELHRLDGGTYHRVEPNERGHYPVPCLGVELGTWRGTIIGMEMHWLRWFDERGNMLLLGHELADDERQRAEVERQRAEVERQRAEAAISDAEKARGRAEALAARLRELGINPDEV